MTTFKNIKLPVKATLMIATTFFSAATLAGQIVVGNAAIADAPMPAAGGVSEISFNFVEMSGQTVEAGDIALTVSLDGITVDNGAASVSGSLLQYFDVDFNAASNTLLFTQQSDIDGFASGDAYISIEVTSNSSASNSSNGFEVSVNALSQETIAGKSIQSYTFTK